jgi:hypothetical protein
MTAVSAWPIVILPLLGVILGAALQYWLSRAADREAKTESARSNAYADYLRAVAAAAHLRSDEDLRDALRDAADAKARIAVYGSPTVIGALARLEEVGTDLTRQPSAAAFVALVAAMRSSASTVEDRNLWLVLLGRDRLDGRL